MTYSKPALWLHTLERALGWTMVQQILSTFFDRWKFKHPKPGDLFQVANEVSGRDLTPFFDQVYRGSAVFDYGVESVTSTETDDETFVERDRRAASWRRNFSGDHSRDARQRRAAALRLGRRRPLAPCHARAREPCACRRRSIRIRFWCSTRTSRTTASRPSLPAGAPRRNGRRRGWCGCRISCSPGRFSSNDDRAEGREQRAEIRGRLTRCATASRASIGRRSFSRASSSSRC